MSNSASGSGAARDAAIKLNGSAGEPDQKAARIAAAQASVEKAELALEAAKDALAVALKENQ